jgi:hypothetical protein
VTGFVAGHLVHGVVDGVEAVLLRAQGEVKLAARGAELAVDAPLEVVLRACRHVRLELAAKELCELCSMLSLFIGGLLPIQADLGIALAVRNARHAEVHADFAALAVEVGHQLVKDILLVLFGDVRVVLHGLAVNAELVLGSELELTLDLFEHIALGVAHGALRRSLGAFIDITANLAKPLFHNCYLHKVLS